MARNIDNLSTTLTGSLRQQLHTRVSPEGCDEILSTDSLASSVSENAWSVRHGFHFDLLPGKRIPKIQLLTELYVKGSFTEITSVCGKELQRHCDDVYWDSEETVEDQVKKD